MEEASLDEFGLPLPLPARPDKIIRPATFGFLQRLFGKPPTEEDRYGLHFDRTTNITKEYPELNDFRPDPLTEGAFADEIREIRRKNFMGTATPENFKRLEDLEKELKIKPTIRYEYIRKLFNQFLDDYKNIILGEFVSEGRLRELQYIRDTVYPVLRQRLEVLPEIVEWPYLYGVDPEPEPNAGAGASMRGSPVPIEGVEDLEIAGNPQAPPQSNVVFVEGGGRRGGRVRRRRGKTAKKVRGRAKKSKSRRRRRPSRR